MLRLRILSLLFLSTSYAHADNSIELPLDFCNSVSNSSEFACISTESTVFSESAHRPVGDEAVEALLREFAGEPWTKQGRPPEIGLAVSGGGSKSAPFAMGVFKRFADEDWLARTDLLSSVSGGGYAAYFLYSHAWMRDAYPERIREKSTDDLETVPSIKDFFADIRTEKHCEKCDPPGARNEIFTPDMDRYEKLGRGPSSCSVLPVNSSRHQYFAACYQDLLSTRPGGSSKTTTGRPWGAYTAGVLKTAISLPIHHAANSLFDWKVPLSPTRRMYRVGIGRTYGTLPGHEGGESDFEAAKSFTFDGLRALYDDDCPAGCDPVPWWIISATNDVVGSENKALLSKTVFEITPSSFGSGNYGYVNGIGIDRIRPLTPLDTVAAAGAFFDSLSSRRPLGIPEWGVFGALHVVNARWGYELPNYRVADSARTIHRFLPWPLYYANRRFYRTPESNYIRIADGGMSGDNTGAYALLRRGTRNIVMADGDQDLNGRNVTLSSLCMLSKSIGAIGYDIVFDGYPDDPKISSEVSLAQICDSATGAVRDTEANRFGAYSWKKKVWTGTVRPLATALLTDSRPLLEGIRIYYIKSAVDFDELKESGNAWKENSDFCPENSRKDVLALHGEPCGMIGYLLDSVNFQNIATMRWPQTSTVGDTANGSANTYEAYRDLGWFLSGRLACIKGSTFYDEQKCEKAKGTPQ
jgi:hypothetical protein